MTKAALFAPLAAPPPPQIARRITCREAQELCKPIGARVLWRPGGVVNWMLPELDAAEIMED